MKNLHTTKPNELCNIHIPLLFIEFNSHSFSFFFFMSHTLGGSVCAVTHKSALNFYSNKRPALPHPAPHPPDQPTLTCPSTHRLPPIPPVITSIWPTHSYQSEFSIYFDAEPFGFTAMTPPPAPFQNFIELPPPAPPKNPLPPEHPPAGKRKRNRRKENVHSH